MANYTLKEAHPSFDCIIKLAVANTENDIRHAEAEVLRVEARIAGAANYQPMTTE